MSRYHSHLATAVKIIEKYDGSLPLVHYLRTFFAAEKKYGSKDRKQIASLCYAYYRTGNALRDSNTEDKILAGLFLTGSGTEYLQHFKPQWYAQAGLTAKEKMQLIGISEGDIFPLLNELSDLLSKNDYVHSFLKQPHFFLRIRPGREKIITGLLDKAEIEYKVNDDVLQLKNAVKSDEIFRINRDVVVQDLNSQKVFDGLKISPESVSSAWDCCAASGGKSILLYDRLNGNVRLTVTDIRESILDNLKKRLQQARVPVHKSLVADLRKNAAIIHEKFDIVICDAPCTGSGTWSRTPEQLYYFNRNKIEEYAGIQKDIVSNTLDAVKEGGFYIYITCSVFKAENELIADYINSQKVFQLIKQEYLVGYDKQADTMYTSIFKRSSL